MSLETYKLRNLPIESAYIVHDFVSTQEEAYLLNKIEELAGSEIPPSNEIAGTSASPTRSYTAKSTPQGWKTVNGRRLMQWGVSNVSCATANAVTGGQIMPKSQTLVQQPLPAFMTSAFPFITKRVYELTGLFGPDEPLNHVLVNEYLPGQGIMPHEDGPAYTPTVTTLSLGSHTILDIYRYSTQDTAEGRSIENEPSISIYLPPRSLFIMKDGLYQDCLHGIAAQTIDSASDIAKCANLDIVSKEVDLERSRRVSLTMRRVAKVRKLF